jgi:hypothetical protein
MCSFIANADLSAKQFYAMKLLTSYDNYVDAATAVGDPIIGILQNKPSVAGRSAQVAVIGKCKGFAGGTINVGSRLTSDGSTGKLAAAAPAAGANNALAGFSLVEAVSGDVFSMFALPHIMQGA